MRRLNWTLLLIALVAILPRLYLSANDRIEYDGYWHVFIAQQDRWENLYWEYQGNAHPPLFYLLLRGVLRLGRSPLVYRLISLLTGVAAVFVLGRIAAKMTQRWKMAAITAMAFGFSLPAIIISCEVRSYMLCTLFVLVSFYFYLDFFSKAGTARSRLWFGLATAGACASHYYAFFYLAATLAVLAAYAILAWNSRNWRLWVRDAGVFVVLIAFAYGLYSMHMGAHAGEQGHVLEFYFQRGGPESIGVFVLRNLRNEFNLFSPFLVNSPGIFLALVALAAAALAMALLRGPRGTEGACARVAAAVTITLLGGLIFLALAGKYPFGGNLRHQFLVFPFAVLCGGVVLDYAAAFLPSVRIEWAVAGVLGAAIIATSVQQLDAYPMSRRKILTDEMVRFRKTFPTNDGVFLDQFNLILYFMHYDNWKWRYLERNPTAMRVDLYQLTRGGNSILLFRDQEHWIMNMTDRSLYKTLAECMRFKKLPSITIFHIHGKPPVNTSEEMAVYRAKAIRLATEEGLCVDKMVADATQFSAEFRAGGCGFVPPTSAGPGWIDDSSSRVTYTGRWDSGTFAQAVEGTVSYSNDAGATARASFEGTELTYVYTKAPNRGKARVRIDGVNRGVVDLYQPTIGWQASTIFGGLPPGRHTVEIQVLRRQSPGATDYFVDLDALQGR